MIHYSCDRCKRDIDCLHEARYVLRMEVEMALDPCNEELVDDVDHLVDLEESLVSDCDFETSNAGTSHCCRKSYDLCADCYRQFMKNPLRNDVAMIGFSKN